MLDCFGVGRTDGVRGVKRAAGGWLPANCHSYLTVDSRCSGTAGSHRPCSAVLWAFGRSPAVRCVRSTGIRLRIAHSADLAIAAVSVDEALPKPRPMSSARSDRFPSGVTPPPVRWTCYRIGPPCCLSVLYRNPAVVSSPIRFTEPFLVPRRTRSVSSRDVASNRPVPFVSIPISSGAVAASRMSCSPASAADSCRFCDTVGQ